MQQMPLNSLALEPVSGLSLISSSFFFARFLRPSKSAQATSPHDFALSGYSTLYQEQHVIRLP